VSKCQPSQVIKLSGCANNVTELEGPLMHEWHAYVDEVPTSERYSFYAKQGSKIATIHLPTALSNEICVYVMIKRAVIL
jgi:hypothetical protein